MINYEEELAKFQPSLEIDEAEEAILHNDLTDISDIIEVIVINVINNISLRHIAFEPGI